MLDFYFLVIIHFICSWVADFLSHDLFLSSIYILIIWYVRPFSKWLFGSIFRFLYFGFTNLVVEGENQQQVSALNKGDIYLSEEELLLNDIRILDIVFIRRKRKEKNETKSGT